MKKFLFSAAMLLVSTASFAQMDKVKAAEKAANGKKFDVAIENINAALANPETAKMAETYNVAGLVYYKLFDEENTKQMLQQPVDKDAMYSSALKVYDYWYKCDELAQQPNEKGKVNNKFRKKNAELLTSQTMSNTLLNGFVENVQADKGVEGLAYLDAYINRQGQPIFAGKDFSFATDSLMMYYAYYAANTAVQNKLYDKAIKYGELAAPHAEVGVYGMRLKCQALKEKGEVDTWRATVMECLDKYPGDTFFSGSLIDFYLNDGKTEEAVAFVDDLVAKDPNNGFYNYMKAYLLTTTKKYEEAEAVYDKAISLIPDNAQFYSVAGTNLWQEAAELESNAPTDFNDPAYKANEEKINNVLKKALPYFEKARELAPDQPELWKANLKTIYYREFGEDSAQYKSVAE